MAALIPVVPSTALWRTPKPVTIADARSLRAERAPVALSILVVDDESLIRWSLRRALTKRGHHVVEAGSAAEAIQALNRRDEAFDAVLLDYRLPDRQDSSLLEEVRTLAPTVLVFMMTAYGDDTMRTVSQWLGARAVVDKPFHLDTFVEMIETAFEPTN